MPAKNVVKFYIEGGIYHIYNRGVEKRMIFLDDLDRNVFIKYLKDALMSPPDSKDLLIDFTLKGATLKCIPRQTKNFHGKIELLAYCLMPNHIHLLLKQSTGRDIK